MAFRPAPEARRPSEIYMVEPYMDHDLNGMLENPSITFSPSQMKLYMKQLLEGTLFMHKVSRAVCSFLVRRAQRQLRRTRFCIAT